MAAQVAGGAEALLVAAVIVHDKEARRVALLRRAPEARFAPGLWDLPCGKSEPGEPITTTAVRELREETGLIVGPEALRVAHVIHGAWGVQAPNGFLTVVFAAYEWGGALENREPEKHAQVCWTDTDSLPEEFVPSTGSALRHYLREEAEGAEGAQTPARVSLRGWRQEAGAPAAASGPSRSSPPARTAPATPAERASHSRSG